MDYISRNHSKYFLMAHLIFVTKYRKKLLIKYGDEIKQILSDIVEEKDFEIIKMEVDKDHSQG
jgi:putative transposase